MPRTATLADLLAMKRRTATHSICLDAEAPFVVAAEQQKLADLLTLRAKEMYDRHPDKLTEAEMVVVRTAITTEGTAEFEQMAVIETAVERMQDAMVDLELEAPPHAVYQRLVSLCPPSEDDIERHTAMFGIKPNYSVELLTQALIPVTVKTPAMNADEAAQLWEALSVAEANRLSDVMIGLVEDMIIPFSKPASKLTPG